MNRLARLSVALLAAVLCAAPANEQQSPLPHRELMLTPDAIHISLFYQPTRVTVNGELEQGADVIVVARGPHTEETFNKKVRVGPLWISSGKVHVSRAPSLFLVFSSRPVKEFLSRDAIDRYELDETAVRRRMQITVEGSPLPASVATENYHTLKVEEGIYQTHIGAIEFAGAEGSTRTYQVSFDWPKLAPPGDYEVSAYECRDGIIISESEAQLPVRLTGSAAEIRGLAMNRSALYGALAVLFALAAGFLIDFLGQRLFGVRTRKAH